MPNGKYLLDTNIVIALMAGDKIIRQRLEETEAVYLSTVVFGELCYGAQNSARAESNMGLSTNLSSTPAGRVGCTSRPHPTGLPASPAAPNPRDGSNACQGRKECRVCTKVS